MEALVLAGGLGTRLRAVVQDVPKPLAPICGKPFLHWLLSYLAAQNFTRVVLSVGYLSEKIISYFGSSFNGLEIDYSIENEPLGTGGAVVKALSKIKSNEFFLLNGDTFVSVDFAPIISKHEARPLIVGIYVDDTSRFGSIKVVNGRPVEFLSNIAGPGLINGGLYLFSKADFGGAYPEKFSLEADYIRPLIEAGGLDLFSSDAQFIDIGVPDDYLKAQRLFKEGAIFGSGWRNKS